MLFLTSCPMVSLALAAGSCKNGPPSDVEDGPYGELATAYSPTASPLQYHRR